MKLLRHLAAALALSAVAFACSTSPEESFDAGARDASSDVCAGALCAVPSARPTSTGHKVGDPYPIPAPGATGNVLTSNGTAWTSATASGGGTVPTGTGFVHITSGSQDSAARTLIAADLPTIALTGNVTGSASGGSIATTYATALSQSLGGTGQTSASSIPVAGDSSGTLGALTTTGLRGVSLASGTPSTLDLLLYTPNTSTWAYVPTSVPATYQGGELGAFTTGNYETATGTGPQLGNATTAVLEVEMFAINSADQVPWSNSEGGFGSGDGWFFDVAASNQLLFLARPSGNWSTGIDLPIGISTIAFAQTGGNWRLSANGAPVITHSASYTAASGTALHRIGIDSYAAGFAFTGGRIVHTKVYSRALSDSELQVVAANGQDNRLLLPIPSGGDSAVVWDYAPNRDGFTTPLVGSTLTKVGSPIIYPLQEQTTLTQGLAFADSDININPAPSSLGDVNQHSAGARLRFTVSSANAVIGVETESPAASGGGGPTSWALLPIYVDGVYQTSVQANTSGREVHDVALTNRVGAVIEIVEGLQTAPSTSILGTYVRSVRSRTLGGIQLLPVPQPAARLVGYGDSIMVGDNAGNPTQQGWIYLLRNDFPGGITVDAYGYRGLCTDYVAGGNSVAPLAAQLASGAQAVQPGGPKIIWDATQTNDYGLSLCSVTNYQTYLGSLLDDVHAIDPTIIVFEQTATPRVVETANSFGSTLSDYRTAKATVCTARPSFCRNVDGTTLISLANLGSDAIHPDTAGMQLYREGAATHLGVWSPQTLASALQQWQRADDGFGGDTWADLSGNGHNLVQHTLANQFGYSPAWLGGRPAVSISSVSSESMATAAYASPLTTGTIFAVADQTSRITEQLLFDGIDSTNRWFGDFKQGRGVDLFAGSLLADNAHFATGVPHAYAFVVNGGSSAIYVDGVLSASGAGGSNALAGLTVGAANAISGSFFFDGHLAEIGVLNTPATTAQIASFEAYAEHEYGVPVAAVRGDISADGYVVTIGNNDTGTTCLAFSPILYINQAGVPSCPTSGPIVFAQGGALKAIGTSCSLTTIAPP